MPAVATQPVALRPLAVRGGVTTPGWLRRAAVLLAVLALMAGGVAAWAAAAIGDAAQTIGRDAEPSVALALGMTAVLADMDAAAVSDALTDSRAAGTSRAFRAAGYTLADSVVRAAQNVTYGEAEAGPLRALQEGLAQYGEAVAESRYIGAGDPAISASRVQWASRVNQAFATPAAQALADANAQELERRWAAYQRGWVVLGGAAMAALAVLAAVLAGVQVWLAGRTRRVVNLPLAVATALVLVTGLSFGVAVVRAHGQLRGAKADAYDSLHVLFQAKAAVSALRAAGSLWLLDASAHGAASNAIGGAEQALLGEPPPGAADLRALHAALGTARTGDLAGALVQTPKLGGLLGTELGNITFGVPEREAATDAVDRTVAAEAAVRAMQAGEPQNRALTVARWLDAQPGGGVAVFAAAQAALDRTIGVNQAAFDADTAAALSGARLLLPVTAAALLLAVALAWGGLWLRLREYR